MKTDDSTPYEMSSIDKPPRVIRSIPPQYPYEAELNRISGEVVAKFIVTKEGKPVNISIIESNPPGVFDESAIKAIENYEFSPGIKSEAPVDVVIDLPIKFTIDD